MADHLIVMLGSVPLDLQVLRTVAGEFGWAVKVLGGVTDLRAAEATRATAAVLFHSNTFGPHCTWPDAVRLLKVALPHVRLVACQGFAEPPDWRELCAEGAFHGLCLPLKDD